MNSITLKKTLQGVGLSEKESTVYLATLEKGIAPASSIAEEAGMNRITAYGVLQKLLEDGLVSVSEKAGVQQFSALPPEQFLLTIQKRTKDFSEIVPMLKSMAGLQELRPRVRFFEGLEGAKKGYAETLSATTEILSIANSQNIRLHWPEYDREYVAKRAEKKIFLRGLAPKDREGKKVHQEDEQYYREIRLLSRDLFPTEKVENEINIFDEKVLIVSFEPHIFAIIIESSAVAQTQKQIFEILWKVSGGLAS
ncbi:MAG: helix-turn-helix domain-containing protein [Candidatus Peregrinibacteria bacterium]